MRSISGVSQKKSIQKEVHDLTKKMKNILFHRCPDKSSGYLEKSVPFSMTMNRLSIMDVNLRDQPFISKDGRYSLIFNREIINTKSKAKSIVV